MLNALAAKFRRAGSVETLRDEGKRALERGEYAQALRLIEKAVRDEPNDADAVFHAGQAASRLGAHRKALAHFERCIALVPSSADAYCYAGFAKLGLGDSARARVYCEDAFARDPHHVENHNLLAALTLPGPSYPEVLAALHRTLTPRTYVEIGVEAGRSLAPVLPSTRVVGIDPAPELESQTPPNVRIFGLSSDEYFATRDLCADLEGLPVDLGFIDGSHLFEQALRDFINLERAATPHSTILIHDTYPLTMLSAERERRTGFWSGDVWRLVLVLKKFRPELNVANVATAPTGLCIVRGLDPASGVLAGNYDAIVAELLRVEYPVLDSDKPGLLNLFPNDLERVLDLVRVPTSTPA